MLNWWTERTVTRAICATNNLNTMCIWCILHKLHCGNCQLCLNLCQIATMAMLISFGKRHPLKMMTVRKKQNKKTKNEQRQSAKPNIFHHWFIIDKKIGTNVCTYYDAQFFHIEIDRLIAQVNESNAFMMANSISNLILFHAW